jgi:hypothetical protein
MPWTAATNNSSSSSFDFNKALKVMNEHKIAFGSHPNRIVMTDATLDQVREHSEQSPPHGAGPNGESPIRFLGVPFESYPTLKECMDRMMNPKEGEKLQLIMPQTIPLDCIGHPWMQEQAKKIGEKYAIKMDGVSL